MSNHPSSISAWIAVLVAAGAWCISPARAHHNTEAMIAAFTDRIESGEATAELYYQRATEYRVLKKPAEAEADLHRALDRDPAYVPALRELALLCAKRGDTDSAVAAASRAAEVAPSPAARAGALALLARLQAQAGDREPALETCRAAFALRPEGEVEWFLLQAELLATLGRSGEVPAALDAGYAATGSIVLRNAWVDALLDDGQVALALPVIETELAESRLKSTWLLRRARARIANGDREAAGADLKACLAELAGRIHPARPDLMLVADRGLANALLGNTPEAEADLARAKSGGAGAWVTAALERALANSKP